MSTSSLLTEAPAREITWPLISIVAAHPDDEVIGLGGQLSTLRDSAFLHITDGATRGHSDVDYASTRRAELLAALQIAGVPEGRATSLGFADQEASHHLAAIATKLRDLWLEYTPAIVFTHSYEGGHPDHDSTAFAVHAACKLLERESVRPPELWEFTSYHAGASGMIVSEFLPAADSFTSVIVLQPEACARKRSMFACFQTQRKMLDNFPIGVEKLRPAPAYDFAGAPHDGLLFYENFDWGMTGERWRALATGALAELGVGSQI